MRATRFVSVLLAVLALLVLAPPLSADVLDDAKDADVQQDWIRAVDLWIQVLEVQPGNRDAVLGLARAVREGKLWDHFPKAEKELTALQAAEPDAADARLELGRLFLARAPFASNTIYRATLYARARTNFAALLEADPTHEVAAIGVAKAYVGTGHVEKAIEALDTFLGHKPKGNAKAMFAKAKILYEQAKAKHKEQGGGYPLSGEVSRLYGRAQGAALSSAADDPTVFDAWMHVAWSSVVLGDRETATKAYERAYALDPESPLPLKGLASMNAHDRVEQAKALERLKRLGPERRRARLKEIYALVGEKKWAEVDEAAKGYVKEFGEDADIRYCEGLSHAGQGRRTDARDSFVRALELDGSHLAAAEELDRRLRKDVHKRTRDSVEATRAVYESYAVLMALAPRNPYVRNNAAFALREAWSHHKTEEKWRDIIFLSARTYEDAARLCGVRRPDDDTPWKTRYAYAQMVNDAGIVFLIFEPTKDVPRAERYLLRALQWSDDGYLDAWTYLKQIYETEERWQDLHDLAKRCATSLKDAEGKPLTAQRKKAADLAKQLAKDGRAKP